MVGEGAMIAAGSLVLKNVPTHRLETPHIQLFDGNPTLVSIIPVLFACHLINR